MSSASSTVASSYSSLFNGIAVGIGLLDREGPWWVVWAGCKIGGADAGCSGVRFYVVGV